ncbi:MAG: glycolate oxidase subunit GlcF [Gammaproteobacteria bacterium]
MQTSLTEVFRATPEGQEAERILRTCVHCGFCTATCPTYQLLGDELDGPRGRIYLMKRVLEGHPATRITQEHLDRCLTCRACETACPSEVQYSRLLDIGRSVVEERVERPLGERVARYLLRRVVPYPRRFAQVLRLARWLRPLLPHRLRGVVTPKEAAVGAWPCGKHERKMLLFDGCVQPVLAPAINMAAARVLDRLGIESVRVQKAGCCGAISHHLTATEEAKQFMRRNIDAWWPYVQQGIEAIVITASGCAPLVKDYADLLRQDPNYAAKANAVSKLAKDIAEVVSIEDVSRLAPADWVPQRVAFHSPCTLVHAQGLHGRVGSLLRDLKIPLVPVDDAHSCCGSAGTYSLLQPALSMRLLDRKIKALEAHQPQLIATANIGCYAHLRQGASVPVRHWIEMLDG